MSRLYAHTVNYNRERGRSGWPHRGIWVSHTPRLIPACRLFGHRPVVDGTDGHRPGEPGYRWVCCDRCGTRPDPQGSLDPAQWTVGQSYTGPLGATPGVTWEHLRTVGHHQPGPWPRRPDGTVGAEIVVGPKTYPGASVQVKVGNAGSEHTLAAHLRVWPLGAIYLHTERHGTSVQRRLNPVGYESRVTGVAVDGRRLRWKAWAPRNGGHTRIPGWRDGSIPVNAPDLVLGRRRHECEHIGDAVRAVVRMPHGDDHDVTLRLNRVVTGRKRWRKTVTWEADWDCRGGISTKPAGHGRVCGSGVPVSAVSVSEGTWPELAASEIARDLTVLRARNGVGVQR